VKSGGHGTIYTFFGTIANALPQSEKKKKNAFDEYFGIVQQLNFGWLSQPIQRLISSFPVNLSLLPPSIIFS